MERSDWTTEYGIFLGGQFDPVAIAYSQEQLMEWFESRGMTPSSRKQFTIRRRRVTDWFNEGEKLPR